jgi:exosortase E/protease (VPEID-CTERM system)
MISASTSFWKSAAARRLGVVVGVLLVEYLTISFAFDAQTVAARGGVWTWMGRAGALGPLLVVATAAMILIGPGLSARHLPEVGGLRRWALGLHLGSALAFFWLTRELFGQPDPPQGPIPLWIAGWAAAAFSTFAALLLGVLRDVRWVVRVLGRSLAAGASLGLLAWLAGLLAGYLWIHLSAATFVTVTHLLSSLHCELVVDFDRRILELEGFRISVAPVCSGIEGFGLFAVLMSAFLVQQRRTFRFPHALLLLPIGLATVWFGNSLRIAALMLLGAYVNPETAVGSFHSKAGWVFFCAITIGLAIISRKIRWWTHGSCTTEGESSKIEAGEWLLPLLVWIALSLGLSVFSSGHDPLYGVRVAGTALVLWHYRRSYGWLLYRPHWSAWAVGAIVGVAWLLLPTGATAVVPLEGWSDTAYYLWLAARTVGAVLVVPLVEELAFRGYFARWLTARDFSTIPYAKLSWLGILGSSLAFGAVHDRFVLASVTGVVYALLARRAGRLVDAVAAHAMSNAVIAAWVLATQSWQHW